MSPSTRELRRTADNLDDEAGSAIDGVPQAPVFRALNRLLAMQRNADARLRELEDKEAERA